MKTQVPTIETEALTRDYGKFTMSPLEGGYGTTLGNALRRVLLSSLPGAAVTAIKINGIHHEFSPIPHAKEDTTRLILNLKELRLRSNAENGARMYLEARGEGVVTAADIQAPPEIEILNPELELLTLDSDEANIEMELVVGTGTGYSPAEERTGLHLGELPVDAIFSPIRKAAYHVEQTRVGRMTNFDRLTIEIWTDGTISPTDALRQAAQILIDQFKLIANYGLEVTEEEREADEGIPQAVYETPIEDLDLSVRAYNCLKRAGITQVGEIIERLRRGDDEMLVIRNFGQKSLDELKDSLREHGFYEYVTEAQGQAEG
ncbi:MAG: DNA-directed RNA polymerase subunit alpha [Chloroflexi bacterium]|nr:MAG: DNA-directed RNA polymerase subunit alpha [Chloroflexota bacterium]